MSGGIWLYAHCVACNQAAGELDPAYIGFADLVRPGLPASIIAPTGYCWRPTEALLAPGAIARSVLSGLFAFNQSLRERYPDIANMLRDSRSLPVVLPQEVQLRVAAFSGQRARVSGAHAGWYLRLQNGQRSDGVSTAASIYFSPLAWHLAHPEVPADGHSVFRQLLDIERWPDVSHWVEIPPDTRMSAATALGSALPIVDLPESHDDDGWRWTWLLNDEICPLLDADVTPPS